MHDIDFFGEIVRNSISVFFGLLQTLVVASFGLFIKMYIDVRSLKKAMNAAFAKIRLLEGDPKVDVSREDR